METKNNMKVSLIIVVLFLFISCKEDKDMDIKEIMDKYSQKAVNNGDAFAYGSYLEYANNSNQPLGKLSLSIMMHHKHKSPKSYYLVFRNMIELNNDNKYEAVVLNQMHKIDVSYALFYLTEGAKNDDINCQSTLESLYRNGYGLEKNEQKADSLYSILEKHRTLGKFYRENKNNKAKVDRLN